MERLIKFINITALTLFTTVVSATPLVIYGEDNRVDVIESNRADYVELSKSTAAMISNSKVTYSYGGDQIQVKTRKLSDIGICKDERFANQPIVSSCSGFLVGDKYLVTAGHCVKDEYDCAGNKWFFNYKMIDHQTAKTTFSPDEVYECKKIISRKLDNNTKHDYALIELNKAVTIARPLKFRRTGKVNLGEELVVIGHPSGLPSKISDNAHVRKLNDVFFTANLDTYGGNSGSAVFNAKTGEVEGILVRGDLDYIESQKGCRISNVHEQEKGRGEDVSFISTVEGLQDL